MATWAITILYEKTTDFSGRTRYVFDKTDVYRKHSFEQMLNLVREFTRTGETLSDRAWRNHHSIFDNLVGNKFNIFNNPDYHEHINEQTFLPKHQTVCRMYEAHFIRQSACDIHTEENRRYDLYGIPYLTVCKPQTGLGQVMIETLHIQMERPQTAHAFLAIGRNSRFARRR